MAVVKCDIPLSSLLDRHVIETAYFRDSYRVPLRHKRAGPVEIFAAIFGHHPPWMKAILIVRNRIASWCGLEVPAASEIINVKIKSSYRVGEKIGVWPIYSLSETELVAGHDDKHLDFRLSVLKVGDDGAESVIVSTICTVHNTYGKIYLFFIVPFHKWGVQRLLSNAVKAGRL